MAAGCRICGGLVPASQGGRPRRYCDAHWNPRRRGGVYQPQDERPRPVQPCRECGQPIAQASRLGPPTRYCPAHARATGLCQVCGRFFRRPSKNGGGTSRALRALRYCSKVCAGIGRRKHRPPCKCGRPKAIGSRQCLACYRAAVARPRPSGTCLGCGQPFVRRFRRRRPRPGKRGDALRYCSRACSFAHMHQYRQHFEKAGLHEWALAADALHAVKTLLQPKGEDHGSRRAALR